MFAFRGLPFHAEWSYNGITEPDWVRFMSNVVDKLITISFAPIVGLNIAGGIAGAIWLLVLGEWRLVLIAILVSIAFPFAYSLISMPQIGLLALMHRFRDRHRKLALAVGFGNMLISHAINLAWLVLVFYLALRYSEGHSVIPYLLFGWEVALGPFQYMATKEPPDSIGTYVAVYLMQVSYLVLAIFCLSGILQLALPLIILITLATEVYLVKFVSRELATD